MNRKRFNSSAPASCSRLSTCCCLNAGLAIQQSFEQHPIGEGNQRGLTITVKNNEPTSATNVNLVANIPVLATLPVGVITITPASPVQAAPTGLQASLGTTANEQTIRLKCTFDPIPGGITGPPVIVVESTATVKSPTDPNLANNTSTAQGQVSTV